MRAVRSVSLEVASGEVVLLRGPSGSGKTTLLALAAGLLTPEGGTITLAGLRLDLASAASRRDWRAQRVGLVFQRGGLASHLTALENVRLMAELAGATRAEAARQAEASLAMLGLSNRAGQRPRVRPGRLITPRLDACKAGCVGGLFEASRAVRGCGTATESGVLPNAL